LFCEKCRSIVFPKDGKYVCKRCGYEGGKSNSEAAKAKADERDFDEVKKELAAQSEKAQLDAQKEEEDTIQDEVPIVGKSTITLSRAKVICEKCGHGEAYYYIRQTRSADEPSTTFYRCCKCNYSWREN